VAIKLELNRAQRFENLNSRKSKIALIVKSKASGDINHKSHDPWEGANVAEKFKGRGVYS
jgi:hypothetical protein